MTQQDPAQNHGFNYSSGMIQTWNQFCFTGGYIEVAVNLPGSPTISGFWRKTPFVSDLLLLVNV